MALPSLLPRGPGTAFRQNFAFGKHFRQNLPCQALQVSIHSTKKNLLVKAFTGKTFSAAAALSLVIFGTLHFFPVPHGLPDCPRPSLLSLCCLFPVYGFSLLCKKEVKFNQKKQIFLLKKIITVSNRFKPLGRHSLFNGFPFFFSFSVLSPFSHFLLNGFLTFVFLKLH